MKSASRPYVSRIKAARYTDVLGAFYDGPTIREHCQLIRIGEEAQCELISPDDPERLELSTQSHQIHRPRSLMDLNGVPAAQADRGTLAAAEIDPVTTAAGAA